MNDYLTKLATEDLSKELSIWLEWMWDMAQPPSAEICEQALSVLQVRADRGDAMAAEFIREIRDYLGCE